MFSKEGTIIRDFDIKSYWLFVNVLMNLITWGRTIKSWKIVKQNNKVKKRKSAFAMDMISAAKLF